MKKTIIPILMAVVLLLGGCAMSPTNVPEQSSTTVLTVVNNDMGLLDIQEMDNTFDFAAWLALCADYDAELEMYTSCMVTTAHDQELQAAVAAIDANYPLSGIENIERYVFALDSVLRNLGYLKEDLIPQIKDFEWGPCWVQCYTDGILEIGYYITGPAAPYVLDATGPKVFVSAEDGRVLFIAYFL